MWHKIFRCSDDCFVVCVCVCMFVGGCLCVCVSVFARVCISPVKFCFTVRSIICLTNVRSFVLCSNFVCWVSWLPFVCDHLPLFCTLIGSNYFRPCVRVCACVCCFSRDIYTYLYIYIYTHTVCQTRPTLRYSQILSFL